MTTENTNQPHISDQAVTAVNDADNQAAQEQVKGIGELTTEELENLPPEKLHEFLNMAGDEGGDAGNAPEPTPEPTPTPTAAPAAGNDGAKQPASMIPKPRFDEVLNHNRDLEAENARLKEQVAFAAGAASTNPNLPRVADPLGEVHRQMDDLDKSFNTQMEALVDKFDNGDLTMKQFRQEERKLQVATQAVYDGLYDKKQEIETARSRPDPNVRHAEIIKDPRLEALTVKLRQDNPWLEQTSDAQMESMTARAYALANKAGYKITDDVNGTWILRQYIVIAGRELGIDRLYAGGSGQPAANAGNGSQAPAAGNAPTAQQRKDKIALANQQPPLPTVAGVNAPTNALGTHDLNKMSDVEIADALPTSALEKLAGITS